jgi:hypothetical protein
VAQPDDLPKDWWATNDVARFLGIHPGTVRHYIAIGLMPEPDRVIPGRNFWKPATIRKWNDSRPGRAQPK